ncbi:MAG: diguanylate cyclase [Deferribacteraceae bacterium]|nr:diguanylate cyclase [Deferribacteraceae bacterium]
MDSLFRWTKIKFIGIPLIIVAAILGVLYALSYYYIKSLIIERMQEDTKSIAIALAYVVESDIEGYNNFIEERKAGTPYFNKMLDTFSRMREENNTIKYIYTIRKSGSNRTEFVLDADYATAQYPAGSTIEFVETLTDNVTRDTMETGVARVIPPTYYPDYGTLIGGSAPIFHNGEVIGTAGVDVDINTMYELLNGFLLLLIGAGLVILLFCLAVLLKSSNSILQDVLKDKLTNAYNKKYTDKILHSGIQDARKSKKDYSVLMLDLDHFKNVNDTYGHLFGDVVLASVAKIIADSIRKEDQFIRYGGEEFVVAVPNADTKQAAALAERIRTNIEQHEIYDRANGICVRITISIGVTGLNEEADPFKLLKLADDALYKAKETRNAVATCVE